MRRDEILKTAGELISGDRADTYGDASENFKLIGKFWSAYLGVTINAADVATLMALLKIARSRGSDHADNFVDLCGYAALSGELQIHPKKETMGDVVSAHMARSRYRGRGDHDKE